MHLLCLLLDIGAAASAVGPCEGSSAHLPFCNTSLSFESRVADLIARIPVTEKLGLLSTDSGGVKQLGIDTFQWWSEGLHGVRCGHGIDCSGGKTTTIFPQPIGAAASFNRTLWHATGDAISTEFRGFANAGKGFLSIFAPNINIFRDPRWGRGQETAGEDPYLSSEYAVQYVSGMQGSDNRYMKTLTTCKHFAAFNSGFNLRTSQDSGFNALVTDQDMADTYLPPFRACITRAHGASVMCSYNAINGVPSCGNSWLLSDVLRGEFGFTGHVVSDCGGVGDLADRRFPKNASCLQAQGNTAPTAVGQTPDDCWTRTGEVDGFPTPPGAKTAAAALSAGTDLDCGRTFNADLKAALDSGDVTEVRVDLALTRLFLNRMRTGEFDPADVQPYRQIPFSAVNAKVHQDLAVEGARQAITLLINRKGALPFDPSVRRVAVIGPNANCTLLGSGKSCNQLGNYATFAPFVSTPADGIGAFASVVGCQGSGINGGSVDPCAAALSATADATVLVVGMLVKRGAYEPGTEGEGNDRDVSIAIPDVQLKLVEAVASATHRAGKPLVVVVMSGSYLDLTPWVQDGRISALLWTGYPGMQGGQALAEVLFGKRAPSGRLPYSILTDSTVRRMNAMNVNMRPNGTYPGRTYRFFSPTQGMDAPIFRFGFGLHYTNFSYNWMPQDLSDVPTPRGCDAVESTDHLAQVLIQTNKWTGTYKHHA